MDNNEFLKTIQASNKKISEIDQRTGARMFHSLMIDEISSLDIPAEYKLKVLLATESASSATMKDISEGNTIAKQLKESIAA